MATAHPSDALLAAYASGTASEGLTLLVSSHLTLCPTCRAAVEDMEAVGGQLLAESQKVAMSADSLDAVLSQLDTNMPDNLDAAPVIDMDDDLPLPLAVREALGHAARDLKWQFRMPGIHEAELDGFAEGEEVSLLRARPGTTMLAHTHTGDECTLILSGEMTDGNRVLRAGDVAEADAAHDHRPRITGTETCYCLIVMTGNVRFTGPFGRALNLFG